MLADKDAPTIVKEIKGMNVEGGLAGKMRVLYEAALTAGEGRMDAVLKARKNIFAQFAQDAQSQLAQLIAVEYLFALAAPGERGAGAARAVLPLAVELGPRPRAASCLDCS